MASDNTIKMLQIDDKTVTGDLDRAGYRKMGVSVRAATNFEEARKWLASEPIDLLVINMDYRGIDAINATRHLKAQEATKGIPIVLTSVQTSAKVRNGALDAGADLFVEQPLPRQYFIEKLKQLLEQKTRTTDRIGGQGEATFSFGGATETCPIGDLSMSGILLATNAPLEDGAVVELSIDIPGGKKPCKVQGEVVRTIRFSASHPDRATGIGIRFLAFSGDAQKRLERYIAKTTHKDQKLQYYL